MFTNLPPFYRTILEIIFSVVVTQPRRRPLKSWDFMEIIESLLFFSSKSASLLPALQFMNWYWFEVFDNLEKKEEKKRRKFKFDCRKGIK